MDLIAYPFRVAPDGAVASVVDGSPEHHADVVAVTVLTRKGERPLAPLFGVTDPTFGELDTAEVNANLATFGPLDLQVELTDTETIDDTTQAIEFTIIDDNRGDE